MGLFRTKTYTIKALADAQGAKALCYSEVGGGALTTKSGSYGKSGAGDAILVIGSDLYTEAPIFWLRAKQAADRGATLIVATEAETRLDAFATTVVRDFGEGLKAAKEAFAKANNTVVLYSGDDVLAQSCADLKPTSLIGVWADANTQGAWEMGYEAVADFSALKGKTVYVAGGEALVTGAVETASVVVAQTASMTEASQKAGVTLPSQTVAEMDGTFTSAERRVQRFFAAVPPMGEALPGYVITAQVAEKMGVTLDGVSAAVVFVELVEKVSAFAGLSYERLAEVDAEERLSIGGTCYENEQGLGAQLSAVAN